MPLLIFNHGDYFFLVYIVCTYGDVAWRLFLVIDSFNWAYTLYLSHLLYKERAGHHNKSLMHKKHRETFRIPKLDFDPQYCDCLSHWDLGSKPSVGNSKLFPVYSGKHFEVTSYLMLLRFPNNRRPAYCKQRRIRTDGACH